MEEKTYSETLTKMEKTLTALKTDLNKVRTGRASLALFDDIRVDYYGTPTPLNQMATLAVPESRLITVQPWDTTMIGEIEKAILKSGLGVTPAVDGKIIRIVIPRLTEERRKQLAKHVGKVLEDHRTAIRNIRRDENEALKKLLKEKKISEDDERRGLEEIQKVTGQFVAKVEELAQKKEEEILKV